MTDIFDARREYDEAKFCTDFARGLCAYADNELNLFATQPVEYNALEEALMSFERAEQDAFEELTWYEERMPYRTRWSPAA